MLLAVGPHTHWFDFILAILVRSFLKEPIHFLGKKELFNPITNRLFRYLGGVPVDRIGKNNTVEQAINYFKITRQQTTNKLCRNIMKDDEIKCTFIQLCISQTLRRYQIKSSSS